jgi:hypothetical protein
MVLPFGLELDVNVVFLEDDVEVGAKVFAKLGDKVREFGKRDVPGAEVERAADEMK